MADQKASMVGFKVQLRSDLSSTPDRGEYLTSRPGHRAPATKEYRAAWDPYSFWMQCKRENYLCAVGNRTTIHVIQPVAYHCIDYNSLILVFKG